jgi:hypothetical protein
MSYLIVTFARAGADIPVMRGSNQRTEKVSIDAATTDPSPATNMVADASSNHGENVADLIAEAKCWVEIGPDPDAGDSGSGIGNSFVMLAGERRQYSINKGDKVSVVAYS